MRQEEDVEVCDCALSADPQVRRERRALVTLMNSDRVDLDEGARSWKFHKCVCLKMDSGPLWQFSLINNSLLRVASNLDEEESKELLEGRWRPNVDDSEDSAVGGDVASLEFGDSAPAPGGLSLSSILALLSVALSDSNLPKDLKDDLNCDQEASPTGSIGSGSRRLLCCQTIRTQLRILFAGWSLTLPF